MFFGPLTSKACDAKVISIGIGIHIFLIYKVTFFQKKSSWGRKWSPATLFQSDVGPPILVLGTPLRYEKLSAESPESEKSVFEPI